MPEITPTSVSRRNNEHFCEMKDTRFLVGLCLGIMISLSIVITFLPGQFPSP